MDSMISETGGLGCGGDSECTVFIDTTLPSLAPTFGPLSVADAKCQASADGAGLSGTYLAWISNATESPSTRFTRNNIPYVGTTGLVIANNYTDLTDGNIQNPIRFDQVGNDSVPGLSPFTGTTPTGLPSGSHCLNWTDNTVSFNYTAGSQSMTDSGWSATSTPDCTTPGQRIYCFEQ